MSCNTCIKANPIPACIDSDEFLLEGLTFPDYMGQVLKARFKDVATSRVKYFDVLVDAGGVPTIDMVDQFPLADHPFTLQFLTQTGIIANFTLTNPDDTTELGCCIDFGVYKELTGSDSWELSSTVCTTSN